MDIELPPASMLFPDDEITTDSLNKSQQPDMPVAPQPMPSSNTSPNDSWELFMKSLSEYTMPKPSDSRMRFIDKKIIDTLSQFDFNARSITAIINCILKTFLFQNKDNLINLIKKDTYI